MTPAVCASVLLGLAPHSGEAVRERVCAAVVAATQDDWEQRWLAHVAVEESALRERVAKCRVLGDRGRSAGLWQIWTTSPAERRAACVIETAAVLALGRLRASLVSCSYLPVEQRTAAYASGSCSSRAGQRISARRHAAVMRDQAKAEGKDG